MFTQRVRKLFTPTSAPPQRTFLRDFSYYTFALSTWVPAVLFLHEHVGGLAFVNGASMYPYLNTSYNTSTSKDICWVNKRDAYKGVKRGMIVSFRSPSNPEVLAVKRVLAVGGDIVITRAPCPISTVEIPPDHVWVEGDNKDGMKSMDSNHYGPIPLNLVEGKLTHVIWPWASNGRVRWEEFRGDRARVYRGSIHDALRLQ